MELLYRAGIALYSLAARVVALYQPKARQWVAGRRDWRTRYARDFQPIGPVLWVHAASLGEFEQGRPVIELFKQQYPDWQVVLTFFSPSGYELRRQYPHADRVFYLPVDTARNARDWIALIRPSAVIFVKYEFWHFYLNALRRQNIPTVLISALFRPQQPFFKPYGRFWRQMLGCFNHIFVQDEASADLLAGIGFSKNVTVGGDTRIDRVLNIAENCPVNPVLEQFTGAKPGPVLIAGSSWPADENLIANVLQHPDFEKYKLVVAPHEPSETHMLELIRVLNRPFVRYSAWAAEMPDTALTHNTLLIDNVGMLNTLYRYGTIAYIGGGFGRGIHNTLEPAAFGLPVIFGPNHQKFVEARALVARGGAFVVRSAVDLQQILRHLADPEAYRRASAAARNFVAENRGATERVVAHLSASINAR